MTLYFKLFLTILLPSLLFSQEFQLSGKVLNTKYSGIAYVNVVMLSSDESQVISGVSTDEQGAYFLENVTAGNYVLKVSSIGYQDEKTPITCNGNTLLNPIILKESTESLEEVSLFAKKPTIKKEAGRLIFNVENTALSEGTLLGVLRNTPKVLVSDEVIKIKNTEATVYINDKKVNLSASDVVQLLESTPANSIKKVEVITTPGARYDASSTVVLNLVMDKNVITGYRGRVFGSYKKGMFSNYKGGISNFYKRNKIGVSVNYNYSDDKVRRYDTDDAFFFKEEAVDELWNSNSDQIKWQEKHNGSALFDYFINENNTLTLSTDLFLTPKYNIRLENETKIFDKNNMLSSRFESNSWSVNEKCNLAFNVDYVSTFKDDSRLSLNLHYTDYDYSQRQNVKSHYFKPDGGFDSATAFRTNSNQEIDIITSQLDWYIPFGENSSIATGVKGAFVESNSSLVRLDVLENQEGLNGDISNIFGYSEEVLAAYIDYKETFGKFSFNGGLRLEQTNIKGSSFNTKNNQDYLHWFPTGVLNYKASNALNIYATYKRSIVRPDYESLNPFQYYVNDYLIDLGNPDLKPAFLTRYDLGVTIHDKHTFEISLIKELGSIDYVSLQDNTTKIVNFKPKNIGERAELNFAYETNLDVSNRLSIYFASIFYYTIEKTTINNQNVELNQWSNYTNLSGNLQLLKDNSLTASFSLVYNSNSLQGLQKYKPQLLSNLAVSKTLFNSCGTISLIASDLFNKEDFNTSFNSLGQRRTAFTNLDNRYVTLGFSYKFGNTTLNSKAYDKNNDERNRLKEKGL